MCRCDQVTKELTFLTNRQLAVLVLHQRDHMSYEEIAQALDITKAQVMATLAAGLLVMALAHQARKAAA